MDCNSRIPILKGKPFFEQLKSSINFIDANMKLIENSVKTSNTNEEYDYVKQVLGMVDKYSDDVNNIARGLKAKNYLKRTANEFEDEVQNLKETLRCKEIDYRLEPFKYQLVNNNQNMKQINNLQSNIKQQSNLQSNLQSNVIQQQVERKSIKMPNNFTNQERRLKLLSKNQKISQELPIHSELIDHRSKDNQLEFNLKPISYTQTINLNTNNVDHMNSNNKCSSIKKKDTFIFKENQDSLIKKKQIKNSNFLQFKKDHLKENIADTTNESIDTNNQYSFDFKLPYNKLKNNYYPSNSNFSVDESLEIEFTPGLKSRRTCKKKNAFNESNASTQDLQQFDKNSLQFDKDNSMKQDLSLITHEPGIRHDLATDKNQENYLKQETSINKESFIKNELIDKSLEQTNLKSDLIIKDISNMKEKKSTPSKNFDGFDSKTNKLSTPKKPPNFDLFNF